MAREAWLAYTNGPEALGVVLVRVTDFLIELALRELLLASGVDAQQLSRTQQVGLKTMAFTKAALATAREHGCLREGRVFCLEVTGKRLPPEMPWFTWIPIAEVHSRGWGVERPFTPSVEHGK